MGCVADQPCLVNKKVLQQMVGDFQNASHGHDLHHITKDAFAKVLPKYLSGPIDPVEDLLFAMCEGDGTLTIAPTCM